MAAEAERVVEGQQVAGGQLAGSPVDDVEVHVVIGVLEKKGNFMGGSTNNFVLIPFSAFDRQFPWIKNSGGDTIHIATVPYTPSQVAVVTEKGRAVLRAVADAARKAGLEF